MITYLLTYTNDWLFIDSVIILFFNPLTPTVAQGWASECPDVKIYKWLLNPVWHRMLLYPYDNSGRQRVKKLTNATYGKNEQ